MDHFTVSRDRHLSPFLRDDHHPRIATFSKTKGCPVSGTPLVRKAFGEALPVHVVNFLLVTIDKRRQRLLRTISSEYDALVDAHLGREHVEVTLARSADQDTEKVISARLSDVLGKQAIPHFRVRPEIIGGLVVRTGDTIYDGSIRRRLEGMRRRLLRAQLGEAGA